VELHPLNGSRELRGQGLYVELGEYQFHVFMDFREIRDDRAGSLGQLHRDLNGSGVVSLEEERKQLLYGELNAAFRTVFELCLKTGDGRRRGQLMQTLQKAIDLFLKSADEDELAAQTGYKRVLPLAKVKRKIIRKKSRAVEQFARLRSLTVTERRQAMPIHSSSG